MGKGDKRSKRGKIFRGSFGKSRPNPRQAALTKMAAAKAAAETPAS
jgi:30S ribosomal protein S31